MKIGIITYWWSKDNYGQLLQCYALQKYLQEHGHDAFLIKYNYEKSKKKNFLIKLLKAFYPVSIYRYIKRKINLSLLASNEKKHDRKFNQFREKYIKQSQKDYNNYIDLIKSPPKADCYIVGSDQVWSIPKKYDKNFIYPFFLNFGDNKIKKISYAASFGKYNGEKYLQKILSFIKKLDYVTCRETSGVELCNKNNIPAKIICDPTLLLSTEHWNTIKETIRNKKFIFAYILQNTCDFSYTKLKKWADEHKLDLIYVISNRGYTKNDFDDKDSQLTYPTIPEWIGYISNAEYVITNSYHCSIFSIMYNKKFAIIPLTGELTNSNNRLKTLFSKLKIKNAEIKNNDYSVLHNIHDYTYDKTFITESKNLLNEMLTN